MMQQMEPSSTFSTYNGSGFSIQYPDNFSASPMSGGVEIKGERADAMVRVDANTIQKGITLDKYVSDNAQKTYHGACGAKNYGWRTGGTDGQLWNFRGDGPSIFYNGLIQQRFIASLSPGRMRWNQHFGPRWKNRCKVFNAK